jgi:hypothetical protein
MKETDRTSGISERAATVAKKTLAQNYSAIITKMKKILILSAEYGEAIESRKWNRLAWLFWIGTDGVKKVINILCLHSKAS